MVGAGGAGASAGAEVWQDGAVTITAAADGSALGNPGPAGWAWYVNDDCWRAGGWPHGTNNMGELMAVLDLFRSTAHMPGEDLHILCDSQYVINSVTKWMPGWKRKGWRKSDGKPVMNVELLKEIDQALVGRKYKFEWVRGHAGHDLNEAADDRARAAATSYQQGVAVRQGPGFGAAAGAVAEAPAPAAQAVPAAAQAPPRAGAGADRPAAARSASRRSSMSPTSSASSTRTSRPRQARTRARKRSSRHSSANSSCRKRAPTSAVPECCCTRTSPKSAARAGSGPGTP